MRFPKPPHAKPVPSQGRGLLEGQGVCGGNAGAATERLQGTMKAGRRAGTGPVLGHGNAFRVESGPESGGGGAQGLGGWLC